MASITRHSHKGFSSSKQLYLDTVNYWDKKIRNILSNQENYKTWLNNKTKNGELILDGNPIYSLITKDRKRALRIIQDEPRSKNPYMQVWTDTYDKGDEGENIPVLTISLELSNKTLMDSLSIIHSWFNDNSSARFQKILRDINKKYESNYVPSDQETALALSENIRKLRTIKLVKRSSGDIFLSNDLIDAIKNVNEIHNSWSKYAVAIGHINYGLSTSLHKYMNDLYALLTNKGGVFSIDGRVKKHYMEHYIQSCNINTFKAKYSEYNEEIQKLNNQLLEEIDIDK